MEICFLCPFPLQVDKHGTGPSPGRVSPFPDAGEPWTSQRDSELEKASESWGCRFTRTAIRIVSACVIPREE